jgi:hypothetical protein
MTFHNFHHNLVKFFLKNSRYSPPLLDILAKVGFVKAVLAYSPN